MRGLKTFLIELSLLLIITTPSFLSLLNNSYFTMHDDQHIVRLYLLDQGIKQGYIFPRWVDGLGFGFGYPLYNFYPPFTYYVAELFHLLGVSYLWSIKLLIIMGFFLASVGIFFLMKKLVGRAAGFLSAALYTFFFYHAVMVYVRGALAEFFSFALLPFLFLAIDRVSEKSSLKNGIILGVFFGILILIHPLVAFPTILFFPFILFFYIFVVKKINVNEIGQFLFSSGVGLIFALSFSSFFWLPSLIEKNYTLTNTILTGELADYRLHYIYPQQFIYSPWGFGGSTQGTYDGLTFQLGKIHIFLLLFGFLATTMSFIKKRRLDTNLRYFLFFLSLLFLSLFMTTQFSSFIWSSISFLSYLQFPWRFLTFVGFFLAVIGGYVILFIDRILQFFLSIDWYQGLKRKTVLYLFSFVMITALVFIYSKYFRPQKFIMTNDAEKTSFEEVAWRISRMSYEFVPKGVKTKKTEFGTTMLAIDKKDLPKSLYQILEGKAQTQVQKNNFSEKIFDVEVEDESVFRLNTYNFPGWAAYLDGKKLEITDKNELKLIEVSIPQGRYRLQFVFEDTPIRKIANALSLLSFLFLLYFFLPTKFKKIRS